MVPCSLLHGSHAGLPTEGDSSTWHATLLSMLVDPSQDTITMVLVMQ